MERLINRDCLPAMRDMPASSVDVVYLDPPFFTQSVQSLRSAKDGEQYSFSDVWVSLAAYLAYMKERLVLMKSLLKESGSIFLHCDDSASHHLRLLLDEVFGEENFRSEIIWTYRRWSNAHKGLLPAHQKILFYSKGKDYRFNTVYTDYSASTNLDQILQRRARDASGKTVYQRDQNGDIVFAQGKQGVPVSDVWDIPYLNPKAKERVGYPTQKPVALLERVIEISTAEGDVVLDPFCGSGTTLVAAKKTGRGFIGIDCNPQAIRLCKERLAHMQVSESKLLKNGRASYASKSAEELAILEQLGCDVVQRNKGIDGFLKKYFEGHPVAVKIQKNGESLQEAAHLLELAAKKKNCTYSVLVRRSDSSVELFPPLRDNMVVIDCYQLQLAKQMPALCP